jgi:hypothetical protein
LHSHRLLPSDFKAADDIHHNSGQYRPVARTPMHAFDLPLENLDLAPQDQHFGLQLGLVAVIGSQDIEQDT